MPESVMGSPASAARVVAAARPPEKPHESAGRYRYMLVRTQSGWKIDDFKKG
jgi:hypothetical protein